MKRLCIDINSVVPLFVNGHLYGVGRTTLELLKAMSQIKDEFDFDVVLYSQNAKGYGGRKLGLPFLTSHFYLPRRKFINDILNTFQIKKRILHYDLYHVPHNTDDVEDLSNTIFTIHDLIVYRYPEMWGGLSEIEIQEHKDIAKNCKAIITCSESSKTDIVKYWEIPEKKVHVIPWGINRNLFSPTSKDDFLILKRIKKEQYFFCPSCNHPRKNLPLLLEAYDRYLREGGTHQLVLLNPVEKDLFPYQSFISENKIVICRKITDDQLVELYTHAKASIVISLFEGFGLPILESLACRTAVISSYNSSLIEAGGAVVDFLENLDAESITQKMIWYEDVEKKDTINNVDVEKHLSLFTWEKCAEETLKIYAKYLNP